MQRQGRYCFETWDTGMAGIYKGLDAAAGEAKPVFVSGASGAGKGALCAYVHARGRQSQAVLTQINCAALPNHLLADELFGSSASERGKFADAGAGTLVIEEVGDLHRELQIRIADGVQSGTCAHPLTGLSTSFAAHLICTSTASREQLRFQGRLHPRLDRLFQEREFVVPRLNDRPRDILLLADFFLAELSGSGRAKTLSPEACRFLSRRHWEGGVRELKNAVTQAFYLASGEMISDGDFRERAETVSRVAAGAAFLETVVPLHEMERSYILHVMSVHDGNKSRAARTLQISLKTLRNKLKEYGTMVIG